jgi:hypothetical protein
MLGTRMHKGEQTNRNVNTAEGEEAREGSRGRGQRMKERNMVGITLCKGKTSWGARGSRWAQGGTAVVKHSWAARKGLGT